MSARDRDLAAHARERLRSALSTKSQGTLRLALIGGGGDFLALDMPRDALSSLERVLSLMAAGHAVTVTAVGPSVTAAPVRWSTQEVAAALGVSRPFVIAEIFAGRLTCTKVGRNRRLAPEEVERYRCLHMVQAAPAPAQVQAASAAPVESSTSAPV